MKPVVGYGFFWCARLLRCAANANNAVKFGDGCTKRHSTASGAGISRLSSYSHLLHAQCFSKRMMSANSDVRPMLEATCVQWVSFEGFYQKKIIKEFAQSAINHSLTGFLAHGKPAVACLEGKPEDIQEFLKHVRTTVFATVPRSARKMTLRLREEDCNSKLPRFDNFEIKAIHSHGAHHRQDMLDRRQLEIYMMDRGVPLVVCAEVLGAAHNE